MFVIKLRLVAEDVEKRLSESDIHMSTYIRKLHVDVGTACVTYPTERPLLALFKMICTNNPKNLTCM